MNCFHIILESNHLSEYWKNIKDFSFYPQKLLHINNSSVTSFTMCNIHWSSTILKCWTFRGSMILIESDPIVESSQDANTLEYKGEAKSPGRKVQRMQNLLKKGRANLSRSKSELGEHNRKILQQLNRGKSGLSGQNKKLMANIRQKEFGTQSFIYLNNAMSFGENVVSSFILRHSAEYHLCQWFY